MDDRLNGGAAPPSDEVRSLLKGELRALDAARGRAAAVTDEPTRRHLQDCRDEIATILDSARHAHAAGRRRRAGGRGGGAIKN